MVNENQIKTEYDNYENHTAIMIATDRMIFNERSAVRQRMIEYSKSYKELHIIVFSKRNLKNAIQDQASSSCTVYSTNSLTKFTYVNNAYKIGKRIIKSLPKNEKILITCQDPFETGLAGKKLSTFRKDIELLIQIHTDLFSENYAKFSILNRIRLFIAKGVLRNAEKVRVVSRKIADSLIKRGIDAKDIILKPIEIKESTSEFSSNINIKEKFKDADKIILIVSRLEKEKNIEMAIKAFAILNKELNGVVMVILGSGSQINSLKRLTNRLGLAEKVIFEGWQTDTYSYYSQSNVLLVTSWYEGYGMVFKEAEKFKIKIISTDVGIARDVNAEIVDWNENKIANALYNCLK